MNNKKEEKFKLLQFEKLLKETSSMPKRVAIWGGIMEGSFGFIFGPSKSGKTTFGENLALSLVVGRSDFWGMPLYDGMPHKVLFIGFEEQCLPRVERALKQLQSLTESEKKLVGKNYIQPDCNFQQSLSGAGDWIKLEAAIKKSKAKIVFIDSLTRLYSGSIEDSSVAQRLTLRLRKLTRDLDITLICIHHTTKNQDKPINQDSMAGSRVVLQEADFAIGISKTYHGHRYLREVFYRYDKCSETDVTRFVINENLWLDNQGITDVYKLYEGIDNRKNGDNLKKVIKAIIENTDDKGNFNTSLIKNKLVLTGVMAKNTMYAQIKSLQLKGKVESISPGYYKSNLGKEADDAKN